MLLREHHSYKVPSVLITPKNKRVCRSRISRLAPQVEDIRGCMFTMIVITLVGVVIVRHFYSQKCSHHCSQRLFRIIRVLIEFPGRYLVFARANSHYSMRILRCAEETQASKRRETLKRSSISSWNPECKQSRCRSMRATQEREPPLLDTCKFDF